MTKTSPDIIVGIDGGGTGCRAAVGTLSDGILGHAQGGPGNVESNFDEAIQTIQDCVTRALADAGLTDVTPDRIIAHVGVAGTNEGPLVAKTKTALPYAKVAVTSDRATTVRGVLGAQDGYVVALGTGTIIARQQARTMTSVGGWGFYVSDQASGAWLGRNVLEETILAEDGIKPHSPLTRAMTIHFGGAPQIFMFTSSARPKDYASFAPDVMTAMAKGDAVASALVNRGATYVEQALKTLGFQPGDVLCLSGGLGPHYKPYLPNALTTNIKAPIGTALDGAFALACDLAKS